jgi:hypothetical protein
MPAQGLIVRLLRKVQAEFEGFDLLLLRVVANANRTEIEIRVYLDMRWWKAVLMAD